MMYYLFFLLFVWLAPIPAHAALLFSSDFENNTFGTFATCANFNYPANICPSGYPSVPQTAAAVIVGSPVRQGTKSLRIIADPMWNPCWLYGGEYSSNHNCPRTEFEQVFPNNHTNTERWYGFSVYIDPSTVYTQSNDPNGPGPFQLHEGGNGPGCPQGSISIPHFYLHFTYSGIWEAGVVSNRNTCNDQAGSDRYSLGSWSKGVWTDFVIHMVNSYTSSGITQVWRDGVLKVNITGPNDHNTNDTMDLTKFGLYQPWWKNTVPPAGEKFVLYYDAIKIGDGSSSYNEVAPGGGAPPTLAAPANLAVVVGD